MLAQHPKTLFLGQSVRYPGQAMFPTYEGVPMERRIEMPVAEDFQMGFAIGLALEGYIPVCIYPRFDFLLLAANQLVNHLDKAEQLWGRIPKVIIRTAVGAVHPLDPGPQHSQDHTEAFRLMLETVNVRELPWTRDIMPSYEQALNAHTSTLLIEYAGR